MRGGIKNWSAHKGLCVQRLNELRLQLEVFFFWLRGDYSSLRYAGFSLWWVLLLRNTGSGTGLQ